MPRFYFHVHDGEKFTDLQGTILPDLEAAQRESVRFGGALLAERPDQFWNTGNWHIQVCDEENMRLFILKFAAGDSHGEEDYPAPTLSLVSDISASDRKGDA